MSNMLSSDILKFLKVAGAQLLLVRENPGTYDPTTGILSAPFTIEYPFQGALTTYKDAYGQNSLVMTNMRKVLIPFKNLNTVPQVGDSIKKGTETFTVEEVGTHAFGGVDVGYLCRVKM